MEYLEIIGALIAIALGYLSVCGTSQSDVAADSLPTGHPENERLAATWVRW